jgi:hypothetical protein
MGYLIIVLIAAIIGAILFWYDDEAFLGFIAGGFVGILIILIVGGCIYSGAKQVEIQTASQPLYSLNNGSGTSGSFFLGSGVVDKTEKYTYLVKTDRGMQIQTVDVDNAYVQEDNSQNPKMITYTSDYANPTLRYWFPDIGSDESYTFVIPKGSIKYQYNIDTGK